MGRLDSPPRGMIVDQLFTSICDDYFVNKEGEYHYDASQIKPTHEPAKQRAYDAMDKKVSSIIIDNTNMKPYAVQGVKKGYRVVIRTHGCIQRMNEQWQPVTVNELLN